MSIAGKPQLKMLDSRKVNPVESSKLRITASDFKVSYDNQFELDCPLLDISGNIIAVLGHNGAGKSTMIKSILGLLPVRNGKLNTFYRNPDGTETLLIPEEHMAFCPESGAVFSDISVESYIKLWCRIKHNDASYYLKQGSKYIELFELGSLLKKAGRELSKGQKRRVQSAIGFLINPSLFLFDEPFDGLDVQKTQEFSDIISSHSNELSFLITSHRMDVIERLADKVIVLKNGEVFTAGSVPEVCTALAPKCFRIENISDPYKAIEILKGSFNRLLANKIGKTVHVVAKNVDKEMILNACNLNPNQVETDEPSLVDAMNLFLKYGGR